MIKASYFDDGPEISLVQNRLTVAGMILAVLFFSGSFTIALYGQWHETKDDYRSEFPQIEIAIALGACLTLLTIGALLLCQQLPQNQPNSWHHSRRWWFAASTIWLFLALTQAMSASLTEVVFGLSFRASLAAQVISISACPIWLLLLIAAPVNLILRTRQAFTRNEFRALVLAYAFPLLGLLALPADVYRLQNSEAPSAGNFASELMVQLLQPLTWSQAWRP